MPLPQVSDRIKELPGQALRAVFAGVGQLLLAADKVRAQLGGPADAPAEPPAAPASPAATTPPPATPPAAAPAAAPRRRRPRGAARRARPGRDSTGRDSAGGGRAAKPPAADPGESRWRSLDKTGNVRVLPDGDEDLAEAPSTPPATAEPAPAETAAAAPVAAEPAAAAPAAAVAGPAPAEPAGPGPAEAAPAAEAALPVVGYDQLTVASLRARLRVLDVAQVQTLLDYEKAHQGRTDVVTMFERRIAKLEQGG